MMIKLVSISAIGVVSYGAVIAFHPGVELPQPKLSSGPVTSIAQTATYEIDPQHCSVGFEVVHLGLSTTVGRFNKCSGTVVENGADLTKASVTFEAEVDSIDTAVAARDTHLKSAEIFDSQKFPKVTFKSTKVTKSKTGYVVTGDLTIKGITKSVAIPFKHYGPLKLEFGQPSTHIGVVADPIVIKRSDFGVGNQFKLPNGTEGASDNVTIRISFEAIQKTK